MEMFVKWVRLQWKHLVAAAVWTNPDVIVVIVALGFRGVCEVGEIVMELLVMAAVWTNPDVIVVVVAW